MSTSDYRPRVTAEVTQEQKDKLAKILPHGWQKPLFTAIVEGVLELYDRGGLAAISAIVTKQLDITTVANAGFKEGSIGNNRNT